MDFSFTSEQEELRRALRDLVAREAGREVRRAAYDSESGVDEGLWRRLTADLGLGGLGVEEAESGTGGDWLDVAVVLEESGAALLPVPLLGTLTACAALAPAAAGAAASGPPQELPRSLFATADAQPASLARAARAAVAGGTPAAVGVARDVEVRTEAQDALVRLSGRVDHVLDGPSADLIVLALTPEQGEQLLAVVLAHDEGVQVRAVPVLDRTRRQAVVELAGAPGLVVGGPEQAVLAVDLLRVALALDAVGAARACLRMIVGHLRTRVQFGRPLGTFQALQHRAADLAVEVEGAVSVAYHAAWAAAADPGALAVAAPLAKAVCAEASYRVAAEAIQMHGGMGFSWEHDAHLYFKRAASSALLLGDAVAQRRILAQRAGLFGAGA